MNNNNRVYKIAIRREQFNKWERRTALTPRYCKKLLYNMGSYLQIKVQPSKSRIYSDKQFEDAGCLISEDISDCDLILGIKQVPIEYLFPNKTYIFFGHVIKAQLDNMKMFDDILRKKIRFIDYEKISGDDGKRLVAFGRFAGNSGTIDILSGLGSFLLNRGIGTIFINIAQSYYHFNIDNAKNNIRQAGINLEISGFVDELVPFIIGVTGTGRCAQGSIEILELFPHEFIEPEEMDFLVKEAKKNPKKYNKTVFIVNFTHKHFVQNIKDASFFDKQDYYNNPQNYIGIFQKKYVHNLSVLINCIYWTDKFPRLVTSAYLKEFYKGNKKLRLLGISDVTCDFMGSIDFLRKFTTIDEPFFIYHPETGKITNDYFTSKTGLLYNSIENMPTQFPLDASNNFGQNLYPFIERILKSDINKSLENSNLPPEIEKAVITLNGKLTSKFTYINKMRKQNEIMNKKNFVEVKEFRKIKDKKIHVLKFNGHLFDTLAINKIMDILIDKHKVKTAVSEWKVGFGEDQPTGCEINITNFKNLPLICEDLEYICKKCNVSFEHQEKIND